MAKLTLISETPNIPYLNALTIYKTGFNLDINCHVSDKRLIE